MKGRLKGASSALTTSSGNAANNGVKNTLTVPAVPVIGMDFAFAIPVRKWGKSSAQWAFTALFALTSLWTHAQSAHDLAAYANPEFKRAALGKDGTEKTTKTAVAPKPINRPEVPKPVYVRPNQHNARPGNPTMGDAELAKQGDNFYKNGARKQALDQYLAALQINSNNVHASYMAGVCYLQTIQKERALSYLMKAFSLDPQYYVDFVARLDFFPDIIFLLGQAYHHGENWDKAIQYYSIFRVAAEFDKGSPYLKDLKTEALKLANRKIYECGVGRSLREKPVKVKITNLGSINSVYPDYAPAVDSKENIMIFTSRRPGGANKEVDLDMFPFEDIYQSPKNAGGNWMLPRLMPGVNTPYHESAISLSADGKTLLMYKDDNGGDIYITHQKNGKWSTPKHLGENVNTEYLEASAFITADSKYLYFSSNRPGGFGGLDLYISEKTGDDTWGPATNLGPIINTEFDDDVPTLSLDNKILYFSSKGHMGMGGYDIFRSHFIESSKTWTEPVNIGYPVNSTDNDSYFTQGKDTLRAYYASVKDIGIGDMDIFLLEFEPNQFRAPTEEEKNRIARYADSTALASERKAKENRLKGPEQMAKAADSASSDPDAMAKRFIKKVTGGENTLAAKTPKTKSYPPRKKSAPKKPIKPIVEEEEPKDANIASAAGKNGGSFALKVKDENGNPAEATVKLIDPKTGATFTAIRNDDGTYTYDAPAGKSHKYKVRVEKEGYNYQTLAVTLTKGKVFSKDISLSPITMNEPVALRNLYFKFDSPSVTEESYDELRALYAFMQQNSSTIIEIIGHTDNLGKDEVNQKVSLKRAEVIVKYLTKKGIASDRLIAKGMGEEKPLATNDDEEDGRELNRRTEFKVISNRKNLSFFAQQVPKSSAR